MAHKRSHDLDLLISLIRGLGSEEMETVGENACGPRCLECGMNLVKNENWHCEWCWSEEESDE